MAIFGPFLAYFFGLLLTIFLESIEKKLNTIRTVFWHGDNRTSVHNAHMCPKLGILCKSERIGEEMQRTVAKGKKKCETLKNRP